MTYNSLDDLFATFQKLKVLIIGDVMIDAYAWGKVDRISPEAPVPVVSVTHKENRLGGAGNVALNVKAMGAEPVLCAAIGHDEHADTLQNLLKEQNLTNEGIFKSQKRKTTQKQRVLAGSQQMMRVDQETDAPLDEEDNTLFFQKISPLIKHCDVVIFQDYDKGVITKPLIEQVMKMTLEAGIPVAVDPKKRNFFNYKDVSLFKPNLKELAEGLNVKADKNNIPGIKKIVDELNSRIGSKISMITLSEKGVYINSATEDHYIPAHIREIADVSGAGDTVISVAALCLATGLPLKLMAGMANLSGGLVCEHVGVVPIDKNEFKKEIETHDIFTGYREQPVK